MRSLPPHARLLDSAEGGDFVEHQAFVYSDDAAFKCLHYPESATDVRRVKVRSQTGPCVVRKGNRLVLVFEPEHTRDGPKDLIAAHAHFGTNARENGRPKKIRPRSEARAAGRHGRTCLHGLVHEAFYSRDNRVANERANLRALDLPIA